MTPAQSRPRCSASRFPLSPGHASFTRAPPPSRRQARVPFALWASATLAPQASAPFARARQPSLRKDPASLVPLVPASLALQAPASLSGPGLPRSPSPSFPLPHRPPLLFPPRPSRSTPALTVAAGGGLRAQRAVARHARPQVVFTHDPQRPALEGPQQQHLLPLLQHVGGVARHCGREAAGGRRRRDRGLRPAPRAWSGRQQAAFAFPLPGTT